MACVWRSSCCYCCFIFSAKILLHLHHQQCFQSLGIYISTLTVGKPTGACTEWPAGVSHAVFSAAPECRRGLTGARFILGKIKVLFTVSFFLQLAKLIATVHMYFPSLSPADLSTLHSHLPSSHLEGEICKLQCAIA